MCVCVSVSVSVCLYRVSPSAYKTDVKCNNATRTYSAFGKINNSTCKNKGTKSYLPTHTTRTYFLLATKFFSFISDSLSLSPHVYIHITCFDGIVNSKQVLA